MVKFWGCESARSLQTLPIDCFPFEKLQESMPDINHHALVVYVVAVGLEAHLFGDRLSGGHDFAEPVLHFGFFLYKLVVFSEPAMNLLPVFDQFEAFVEEFEVKIDRKNCTTFLDHRLVQNNPKNEILWTLNVHFS